MRGRLENKIETKLAEKLVATGDRDDKELRNPEIRHKAFSLYGMEISLLDVERERLVESHLLKEKNIDI